MAGFDLGQTFQHKSATHEFTIKWTRLGEASSPPLILIHGTPWSSDCWHDLAVCLASRYNIYVYDHPGFSDSPTYQRLESAADESRIDLDGSLVLRAEASAALIKHWKLSQPPHVVAHDNGGLVSMRLLLEHDIKLASLCLVDVVVLGGKERLPFFKLVNEHEGIFTAIPPIMLEGLTRAYIKNAMYKPVPIDLEDNLSAPWLENGKQGPKRFLDEMRQAYNRDTAGVEDKYSSVGSRIPVKIIWGRDDAWIPSETAQEVKNALNAQEVAIIAEAGHLVHYDQPSKLAVEVALWIEKCSKLQK